MCPALEVLVTSSVLPPRSPSAGRRAEHQEREAVQPLQDPHACQEASPPEACQLLPECCREPALVGVGQSTQLPRARYLTPASARTGTPPPGFLRHPGSDTQGLPRAPASEDETCNTARPPLAAGCSTVSPSPVLHPFSGTDRPESLHGHSAACTGSAPLAKPILVTMCPLVLVRHGLRQCGHRRVRSLWPYQPASSRCPGRGRVSQSAGPYGWVRPWPSHHPPTDLHVRSCSLPVGTGLWRPCRFWLAKFRGLPHQGAELPLPTLRARGPLVSR